MVKWSPNLPCRKAARVSTRDYIVCVPFSSSFQYVYTGLVHCWLYDRPGVLHRDLSLDNTMYRIIEVNAEGDVEYKVYGVPTDYDLSSWTASLKTDYIVPIDRDSTV